MSLISCPRIHMVRVYAPCKPPFSDKASADIYNSEPHCLVALSRHTESLVYYTRYSGDDSLTKCIKKLVSPENFVAGMGGGPAFSMYYRQPHVEVPTAVSDYVEAAAFDPVVRCSPEVIVEDVSIDPVNYEHVEPLFDPDPDF